MPSNPPSSRRDHSSARTSIDDPVQRKYLPSASKVVMSLDDCSNNSKDKINKSLVVPLLKIEHTTTNTYKHNTKAMKSGFNLQPDEEAAKISTGKIHEATNPEKSA